MVGLPVMHRLSIPGAAVPDWGLPKVRGTPKLGGLLGYRGFRGYLGRGLRSNAINLSGMWEFPQVIRYVPQNTVIILVGGPIMSWKAPYAGTATWRSR